jgi:hypothetical protein
VPQFAGLPLTILRAISEASGENYIDLNEFQLKSALARRNCAPGNRELRGAMRALQNDGYIECYFGGGEIFQIRLATLGRQAVEGWPTSPGAISASDVERLIEELQERSTDPSLTPDEQSKARAAAGAIGGLGLSVAGGVIVGWLKSIGVA